MSTSAFISRTFNEPLPEHKELGEVSYESITDLDDPQYNWEYFGNTKYGRYAVCSNTGIKRSLTMGEFYGASAVD